MFCFRKTGLSEISRIKKWKIDFYQNVKKEKSQDLLWIIIVHLHQAKKSSRRGKTMSSPKFTQTPWLLTKGAWRFSYSFTGINWTIRSAYWANTELGITEDLGWICLPFMLYYFVWEERLGNMPTCMQHLLTFSFVKKCMSNKTGETRNNISLTKRSIYSSHADSCVLREVKILFQYVVQVITLSECRNLSSVFFSAQPQHYVSSRWISIRVRSS